MIRQSLRELCMTKDGLAVGATFIVADLRIIISSSEAGRLREKPTPVMPSPARVSGRREILDSRSDPRLLRSTFVKISRRNPIWQCSRKGIVIL